MRGDKAKRDLEALTQAVDGGLNHPEAQRVLKQFLFNPLNRKIAEKIAAASSLSIEELPPDVVRYWIAANSVLAPQGYTLTVDVHDWYANSGYSEIDVRPVIEDDIFGYDSPPIRALFIISKKTGKLATNGDIIESLRDHAGNEPIDYVNEPAYGLEFLIRAKFKLDPLGKQVVKAFLQASPGTKLIERAQVGHGLHDYGYEAIVLYQPQIPAEPHNSIDL